jgi:predicted AAA+ superfamily ATPase
MAGRFERLRLGHWQAADVAALTGDDPLTAAHDLVAYGGYPGALDLRAHGDRWTRYVRDSIVEPAIGRDLLATRQVRRPGLLRQVFAVAAGHPAEIMSLQKIAGRLQLAGALETVAAYLALLEDAFLVAAIQKYSGREVRRRASPPKLVTLSNAILGAMSGGPVAASDAPRWGRWLENACIAMAWNCGQSVFYWREEPLEVDLVTTGSWGNWAIEIKTGAAGPSDLRGILEFCRRHEDFAPMFVCDPGREPGLTTAGVAVLSWPEFLVGKAARMGSQGLLPPRLVD